MTASRFLSVLALGFFVAVIIAVLWQIETNFKEQGIASGGPYDNAASFPRAVVFLIGFLLLIQCALDFIGTNSSAKLKIPARSDLMRAGDNAFYIRCVSFSTRDNRLSFNNNSDDFLYYVDLWHA